jgi:hypothetical protein
MSLYNTDLEDTRQLLPLDPSIQAGRMRAEIMTWLTPRGELAFPRLERQVKEEA